ncbi:MerR family DNA-binding transcriptional regulator [Kineococcus sp. T90]|nr:MerR family DNA-binding transcriptional regulator [Kineococcus indalonis]
MIAALSRGASPLLAVVLLLEIARGLAQAAVLLCTRPRASSAARLPARASWGRRVRTPELARAAAVAVSTVRFYEREGLLPAPARQRDGYRAYTAEDVRTVRFLRRGQGLDLGFTLAELAAFTRLSGAARSSGVLAADVAEHAHRKVDEIAQLLAAQCLDTSAPCPVVEALAG